MKQFQQIVKLDVIYNKFMRSSNIISPPEQTAATSMYIKISHNLINHVFSPVYWLIAILHLQRRINAWHTQIVLENERIIQIIILMGRAEQKLRTSNIKTHYNKYLFFLPVALVAKDPNYVGKTFFPQIFSMDTIKLVIYIVSFSTKSPTSEKYLLFLTIAGKK